MATAIRLPKEDSGGLPKIIIKVCQCQVNEKEGGGTGREEIEQNEKEEKQERTESKRLGWDERK